MSSTGHVWPATFTGHSTAAVNARLTNLTSRGSAIRECYPLAGPWNCPIRNFGAVAKDNNSEIVNCRLNKAIYENSLGSAVIKSFCTTGFVKLLEHWDVPYRVSARRGPPQFVNMFLETLYTVLGMKHFMITAYHPENNGQA